MILTFNLLPELADWMKTHLASVFAGQKFLDLSISDKKVQEAVSGHPDLIIFGFQKDSPERPGLINQIKEDPLLTQIPVIIIGQKEDQKDPAELHEMYAADAVIFLPGDPYELNTILHSLIELGKSRKRIRDLEQELNFKNSTELTLKTSDRIFQHSLDMLCIAGFDGHFKVLNPAWEKMLGWSIEELLKHPWLHFVHPDDREATINAETTLVDGREIYQFVNRYLCKNGDVKWLSWNSFPNPDEGIMFGVVRDITNQKLAEEKLSQTRDLMQYIIEHSNGGIAVHDRDMNYIYVSQRYIDQYKITDHNILGRNHYEVFPDLPQKWRDVHQKVLKGQIFREDLDPYLKEDGTTEWTRWECRPWYESEGKIGGLIVYTEIITNLVQERENLRISEEKYRRITENISDVVWTTDLRLKTTYVSPSVKRLLGDSPEKHMQRSLEERFPPESLGLLMSALSEELEEEKDPNISKNRSRLLELKHYTADSRIIWVSFNVTFIRDDQGSPIGVQGVARDISARKKAEEDLQNSYNMLAKLTEQVPGVVYQYRLYPDGRSCFPYSSTGMMEIYGYRPEDVLEDATPVFSRIHPEDFDYFSQLIMESAKKLKLFHIEFRVILPDKGVQWRMCDAKPERMDDGGTLWYGIITDISRRKRDENIQHVLHDISRASMRTTNLEDLLVTIHRDLSRVINSCCLSYAANIPGQKNLKELRFEEGNIQSAVFDQDKTLMGQVIQKEQSLLLNREEIKQIEPDKKDDIKDITPECWLGVPVIVNEQVAGVLAIHNCKYVGRYTLADTRLLEIIAHELAIVIEKNQMVDDLIAAKEKAVESDRLKSAFLANMSHEIRTPMNGILGFLSLLDEPGLEDDERTSYIEIMNSSGQRLLTTINDIIEISKIEAGQSDIILSNVNVNEIIQYHYNFFYRQAEAKGLKLEVYAQVSEPDNFIQSDSHKISGILNNLINNAIKFTQKGEIEIGNYLRDHHMILYVKDSGRGIPVDKQHLIFERFMQAEIGTNRSYDGSGLGLAISKAYTEALGGKIWFEPNATGGTTFFFSIPINRH